MTDTLSESRRDKSKGAQDETRGLAPEFFISDNPRMTLKSAVCSVESFLCPIRAWVDERAKAEDGGIPPLVDDSYSFTEEGAKIFAGDIITQISNLKKVS